jgi:hypothetical protein
MTSESKRMPSYVRTTYIGPANLLEAYFAENITHLVLARRQYFILRLTLLDIYSKTPMERLREKRTETDSIRKQEPKIGSNAFWCDAR